MTPGVLRGFGSSGCLKCEKIQLILGSSAYLCVLLTVVTSSTVDFGTASRYHSFSVAKMMTFLIELMAGFPAETVCQGWS